MGLLADGRNNQFFVEFNRRQTSFFSPVTVMLLKIALIFMHFVPSQWNPKIYFLHCDVFYLLTDAQQVFSSQQSSDFGCVYDSG